jgi:hypothetical protein
VIGAVVAAAANMCGAVVGATPILAEMPLVMLAANVLHGVIAALTSQGDARQGEHRHGREG